MADSSPSHNSQSPEDCPVLSDHSQPIGIYAHAGDPGLQYVLMPMDKRDLKQATPQDPGGLFRTESHGHFVTIVGRGGTGKSILSLQLICQLVEDAGDEIKGPYRRDKKKWDETQGERYHSAFYFTLESPHRELALQAGRFRWGEHLHPKPDPKKSNPEVRSNGVRIISAPSATQDITGLVQFIRQNIAKSLDEIRRVVAIVIDPFGGVDVTGDLRHGLLLLRDLCQSHRVFLFLLVEDFLYTRYPSIEHYSETIIHLEHDPGIVPHRRLHIQKARHQRFYSGYHQFWLHANVGFRLYPSLRAQSKGAHDELKTLRRHLEDEARNAQPSQPDDENPDTQGPEKGDSEPHDTEPFFSKDVAPKLAMKPKDLLGKIRPGSVIFLMGPPGTFKQNLATGFALSAPDREQKKDDFPARQKLTWPDLDPEDDDSELHNLIKAQALYISFKAEPAVVHDMENRLDPSKGKSKRVINFLDSRDPILTPEEVLFRVRRRLDQGKKISRAVIWGLRRLRDMPRFTGEKAVQFLEALVTLLTSRRITSLLIDWPDIEKASQLPIVDLSQYIILTRVCHSHAWFQDRISEGAAKPGWLQPLPKSPSALQAVDAQLWKQGLEHVALLRVHRKAQRFVRNEGVILSDEGKSELRISKVESNLRFEDIWNYGGMAWEEDPGLVEFGALAQRLAEPKK